ncbi:MAG TPA: hypothetical protein VKB49_22325 [Candidatus Sulfotelmatobacter sp.]|nr:hypothetical protein [Candidatus Sulfotelmatobacter sp.]
MFRSDDHLYITHATFVVFSGYPHEILALLADGGLRIAIVAISAREKNAVEPELQMRWH